ncbi:MAG: hypothetical protein COA78_15760 [Blastopirellula sp.]|nr:MAG: hypothetical protein COA78_15760 [Blastopirellula sp.]
MYRTSTGERTLKGKEAEAFQHMLSMMLDEFDPTVEWNITDPEMTTYGITAYDEMSFGQKLWSLNLVSKALLVESITYPPLVAYVEATVATVFIMADVLLDMEKDSSADYPKFTDLMKAALAELAEPGDESCDDFEPSELVTVLEERIFWDQDYLSADIYLDSASESSRPLDEDNGGYYTAIAHDPPESQYKALYKELIELMEV